MKIIEIDRWNAFYVALEKEPEEERKAYLKRAVDHLRGFYTTHTADTKPIDIFWMSMGDLENIAEGGNFCDMNLKTDCNVYYRLYPDGYGPNPAGIHIYSHRIGDRKPQIEFLKEKWAEFKLDKQK